MVVEVMMVSGLVERAPCTLHPFFILESMHQCKVCMSFENGDDMVPCDAEECLLPCPGLAHETCLVRVTHQAYPDGAFLCQLCIDAGNGPYVADEDTSEYDESDFHEGDEDGSSNS